MKKYTITAAQLEAFESALALASYFANGETLITYSEVPELIKQAEIDSQTVVDAELVLREIKNQA